MPDDKIVRDGYLLTEEPEPEWDLARSTPVQAPQIKQEWEGGEGNIRLPAASFSRWWALSLISLSRCVWQPPIIQLLFNFVFKQYYQHRTSDGCTVLS